MIAPFTHINSGNHGYFDFDKPIMSQKYLKAGKIFIGKGCWIGRSTHILGGSFIGENSVAAANSVVTKPFKEKNIILAGIPAKIIRKVNNE